ncbi:MAG: DNA-directed DNA polymerase [Methanobacteriaceae archaeon]|nr:DNA-directed DNA polymerase [Methanobacteriaceae archaeon]
METINLVLNDIDYITHDEKPIIRLFGQDTNTKENIIAIDKTFKPYIYIKPYNTEKCIEELKILGINNLELVKKIDIGVETEFIKATFTHPQEIPKLRDIITESKQVKEIREHDILFYRRYLINNNLIPTTTITIEGKEIKDKKIYKQENTRLINIEKHVSQENKTEPQKILIFDIEVYNKKGMPQAERDPIIMIGLADNKGYQKVLSTKKSSKEYVKTLSNEKEMLYEFQRIIQEKKPDIIIGYNSDNFDLPYIKKRTEVLKIKLNLGIDNSEIKFIRQGFNNAGQIKGVTHIDLYKLIRSYLNLDRYTLERVYKELFNVQKHDLPGDQIWEYWEDPERIHELFEYSLDDAIKTEEIAEKIIPLTIALTRLVGEPLFDIGRMTTGQMVEWYLIRKAYEQNNIIPNKPTTTQYSKRRGSKKIIGGYVKEPEKGLFEDIAYLDFRSLYPSIIIAKNISPDTILDEEDNFTPHHKTPELNYKFKKDPKGFIPSIIGNILTKRQEIKSLMKKETNIEEKKSLDLEQQGLKRLANSMFGAYGYSRFRWYKLECAESITAWGRDYIRKSMDEAEKQGFKPLYADTDGFYATYIGDK